jgi:hypothetical protein
MAGSSLDGCCLICAKHSTVAHTGERISAPRQQTTAGVPLAISSRLAASGWVASLALEGAPSASTKGQRVRTLPQCQRSTSFFSRLRHAGLPMPRREATNASWPSRLGLDLRPARRRHWRPAVFRRLPIGPTASHASWRLAAHRAANRSGCGQAAAETVLSWPLTRKAGCLLSRRRRRPASPPKKSRSHARRPHPPTSSPRTSIGVVAPSEARARPPPIGGLAPSRPVGA